MPQPVDVVLLTKNSARILKRCLESIYKEIPVGQLIVVDGYSTDKTLDIIHEFDNKHHNVKLFFDNGTRATARQKGISHVQTEWFAFVDSDVVLCKNWYDKAAKYINERVGAIWGIEVWSTITKLSTLKMFLIVTRKIFDVRGGTHDTLIRTAAVSDIKIPPDLHVFEDAYIKDWITMKGYQIIACYSPFCHHYRPQEVWSLKGSLSIIVEALKCGNVDLLGKLCLAYGFYTAYSFYRLIA